jgi:hypothetical protein
VCVQVGANAAIIHYKPCASTAATLDRHHMCGTLACTRRLRMRALGIGGGRPSTAAVRSAAVARPTATALRPHGAALRSAESRECELAGGRAGSPVPSEEECELAGGRAAQRRRLEACGAAHA